MKIFTLSVLLLIPAFHAMAAMPEEVIWIPVGSYETENFTYEVFYLERIPVDDAPGVTIIAFRIQIPGVGHIVGHDWEGGKGEREDRVWDTIFFSDLIPKEPPIFRVSIRHPSDGWLWDYVSSAAIEFAIRELDEVRAQTPREIWE